MGIPWAKKLRDVGKVFTPATPIMDQKFFCGRIDHIDRLLEIIGQPGMHGILFGERGVGKTSLAYIVTALAYPAITAHVSCNDKDDFASLWRRALRKIGVRVRSAHPVGYVGEQATEVRTLADMLPSDPRPHDVADALATIRRQDSTALIVFDEFDRLSKEFPRGSFADTIKSLSDQVPHVHLLLVGVADTVVRLIGQHQSIERSLRQVRLPAMSKDELRRIINNGATKLEMKVDSKVSDRIVDFSSGYPHFTHLLALHACTAALKRRALEVTHTDFVAAVEAGIEGTDESLREGYRKATHAPRRNTFKEVLSACAMVDTDSDGTFQAAALTGPLSTVRHKKVAVDHGVLAKLASDRFGNILIRIGEPRRYRYKFANPLMKAYVRLVAYRQETGNVQSG